MKTKVAKIAMASVVLAVVVLVSLNAGGGSLEPPGSPASTMHSLDEIYDVVDSQTSSPSYALNAFLRVDGVNGESQDADHRDWIEILSYKHKVTMPIPPGGGGGSTQSKHEEVVFVKETDKATPILLLLCCNGNNIPEVTLHLCREVAMENIQEYYEIILTGAAVTSVRSGTGVGPSGRPMEEVGFTYTEIEWIYTEYDHDGLPQGGTQAHWDVVNNTGG